MEFKSLQQLILHFQKEETCIKYLEELRWGGNPVCPYCESENPYKIKYRGYKCSDNQCYKKFNVKAGTIFEKSKIKLPTWFAAIYLCVNHKKGISSVQLSLDLNVTQKTAWFMLHRIREMMKDGSPLMLGGGTVEVDETHVGGKEKFKHFNKKRNKEDGTLRNDGTPYKPKMIVTGIVQRDGKVVLKYTPEITKEKVTSFIEKHVDKSAIIYTDESKLYKRLNLKYEHDFITHKTKTYVRGDVHTNTIENFWSTFKRGLKGVYHKMTERYLERYLDEYSARYNTRDISISQRFEFFLKQCDRSISFKQLTCDD